MNIFSWFSAWISGISLQEERQRNPQIILSILSQNFDWSVCTTSSSSWLLFFFCLNTMKIANSSQIMQVAVWWEIIFVANKTRQIMQRIFNDRKFFMGIGKYQKICILLLHTGFWIEFWRENSNIFPVFASLILGQNLDFGTKIQMF